MDPEYSRCVQKVFVELYKKGLIYRGKRMVNWDPVSLTAISDEEVIMKEQKGSQQLKNLLPLPFDAPTASVYLKHNREIQLRLRFTLGAGRCTFFTCDLTPEYIRLNADYTT